MIASSPLTEFTPVTPPCVVPMPRDFVVSTRQLFRATVLARLAAGCKAIVIDCAETGYIDSSGCGVLVSLNRAAKDAGATFRIRGLSDDLRTVFALTRIDTVLDVEPRA
jgi:anti-sigma B factor antagonist